MKSSVAVRPRCRRCARGRRGRRHAGAAYVAVLGPGAGVVVGVLGPLAGGAQGLAGPVAQLGGLVGGLIAQVCGHARQRGRARTRPRRWPRARCRAGPAGGGHWPRGLERWRARRRLCRLCSTPSVCGMPALAARCSGSVSIGRPRSGRGGMAGSWFMMGSVSSDAAAPVAPRGAIGIRPAGVRRQVVRRLPGRCVGIVGAVGAGDGDRLGLHRHDGAARPLAAVAQAVEQEPDAGRDQQHRHGVCAAPCPAPRRRSRCRACAGRIPASRRRGLDALRRPWMRSMVSSSRARRCSMSFSDPRSIRSSETLSVSARASCRTCRVVGSGRGWTGTWRGRRARRGSPRRAGIAPPTRRAASHSERRAWRRTSPVRDQHQHCGHANTAAKTIMPRPTNSERTCSSSRCGRARSPCRRVRSPRAAHRR